MPVSAGSQIKSCIMQQQTHRRPSDFDATSEGEHETTECRYLANTPGFGVLSRHSQSQRTSTHLNNLHTNARCVLHLELDIHKPTLAFTPLTFNPRPFVSALNTRHPPEFTLLISYSLLACNFVSKSNKLHRKFEITMAHI